MLDAHKSLLALNLLLVLMKLYAMLSLVRTHTALSSACIAYVACMLRNVLASRQGAKAGEAWLSSTALSNFGSACASQAACKS